MSVDTYSASSGFNFNEPERVFEVRSQFDAASRAATMHAVAPVLFELANEGGSDSVTLHPTDVDTTPVTYTFAHDDAVTYTFEAQEPDAPSSTNWMITRHDQGSDAATRTLLTHTIDQAKRTQQYRFYSPLEDRGDATEVWCGSNGAVQNMALAGLSALVELKRRQAEQRLLQTAAIVHTPTRDELRAARQIEKQRKADLREARYAAEDAQDQAVVIDSRRIEDEVLSLPFWQRVKYALGGRLRRDY